MWLWDLFKTKKQDKVLLCPACGNDEFYAGPEGGGQNMLCSTCYNEVICDASYHIWTDNGKISEQRLRLVYGIEKSEIN